MANPFSDNPYEPPVVAEVVGKRRPKRKPLPVLAIALVLVFIFVASVVLGLAGYGAIGGATFLLSLLGTLFGVVGYEVWSWFFRD